MDFVKIYSASNNMEADLIKAFLENHDIPASIKGYHHRSMLGLLGPYIGLDITVPKNMADQATRLLKEYEESHHAEPLETPIEEPKPMPALNQLKPRSIAVAFMLAFIFPGMGNFYVGRKNIGGWIICGTIICYITLLAGLIEVYALPISISIGALIVIDAYTSIRHIRKTRQ